jgi:S-adenosylmethionine hydrolase
VAAHLSLGEDPSNLGQPYDDWVRLETKSPIIEPERLVGEVIFVDHFGNLITNIPGSTFAGMRDRQVQIVVGDQQITQRVRTYGEAEIGTAVALISSFDLMEVAVTGGSAQKKLGASVGAPVSVRITSPSNTSA